MKKVFLIPIFIIVNQCCVAQQKESIKLFKQFIAISKGYQQPPLQAQIQFNKNTNWVGNIQDTISMQGSFNIINGSNAYIKFGNTEQIIADSIVVMVSNDIKRMVVFEGSKEEMQRKMMKIGQVNYPDSAYKQLAKYYTVESQKLDNSRASITLISIDNLVVSNKSKESIEMEYNTILNEPIKITTTKRYLKPIKDSAFLNDATQQKNIVHTLDKGDYLIIEKTETFLFTQIEHNAITKLPVTIADRIIRNEDNEFVAAMGFEAFTITKNIK